MIADAAARLLRGGCFFVAPPAKLRVEHVANETVPWEIFRGHLLGAPQSQVREHFAAWHVFLDDPDSPAAAPLISLRWQSAHKRVFVTRQILSHGFEAYEDEPGV